MSASWLLAQPVITLQPVSQSVSTGTDVSFIVTAEDAMPGALLMFQWRRNGVDIPGTFKIYAGPMATDHYDVLSVQPTNCGNYSVVVFDRDAVSSAVATLVVTNILTLPSSNSFAASGDLGSGPAGVGRGDNLGATKEPGEPDHGSKRGGASVWLRWTAPFNGIATFYTLGSGFDTTLGIYTGDGIANLTPANGDDDLAGFLNSTATFNALGGTQYNIAIDGYYGDQGNLILNWSLEPTPDLVPVIMTQPVGQTLPLGSNASFFVVPASNNLLIEYQWFLNSDAIPGATASNYTTLAEATTVGTYRVRLRSDQTFVRNTFSQGASLQVNISPDVPGGSDPNASAMRKFREAIDPIAGPPTPARPTGPQAAAVAGFSGTQIFNTFGSVKEPGEPNHCGEPGGASYWFAYTAPANGMLSINTSGSGFNNVLATYTGPGYAFTNLVTGACSSTNAAPGSEAVFFPVTAGVTNFIVLDGVAAATGIAYLNYNLGAPPAITTQPLSQTAWQGSNVTLTVTATGTPNLGYRWRSNSIFLVNRTNTSLTVSNIQSAYEAGYDVVVTNALGAVTSSVAMLYLNDPLRFTNTVATSNLTLTTLLVGRALTNYIIQTSTNLGDTNWVALATNSSAVGLISYTDTNAPGFSNRFFRARSQ